MRIEAYTQVQQLYKSDKSAKATKTASTGRQDQVEISSIGKDFQTVKKAVAESADIREERTAPIKASINAGTYQVSGEKFADKLIAKYDELTNY